MFLICLELEFLGPKLFTFQILSELAKLVLLTPWKVDLLNLINPTGENKLNVILIFTLIAIYFHYFLWGVPLHWFVSILSFKYWDCFVWNVVIFFTHLSLQKDYRNSNLHFLIYLYKLPDTLFKLLINEWTRPYLSASFLPVDLTLQPHWRGRNVRTPAGAISWYLKTVPFLGKCCGLHTRAKDGRIWIHIGQEKPVN